jgi:hypothetical protein
MPHEILFVALGWWPFPTRPPPDLGGNGASVLPAIASSPNYDVNPWQELLNDRWCHILEFPGRDKLWLDCDRGCAILAREFFNRVKQKRVQRIETFEHREIQPGIWVPQAFRNMVFDPDKSEVQGSNLVASVDTVVKILEIRLNEQVHDDVFHFDPLPGSVQTVADNLIEQAVPGGTEYLDEVIDGIKRQMKYSEDPASRKASMVEGIVEFCIIAVGAIIFIWCSARRRMGRAS